MLKSITLSTFRIQNLARMSIFVQKLNPVTGSNDWVVEPEDYDYHQEVARSSFADMLHDTERNVKYEQALKSAIELMHSRGLKANVLDIGTGTGLLSMMAVRHGADSVTACEAFEPMSQCALKVIKRNGYSHKINLIPKRSTDIIVGPGGDLTSLCNILVTEVFDTELIGEGALSTFQHAHNHLLEKDCIVVPQSATIYAQVVECPAVHNWNRLKDTFNDEGELLIQVPPGIKKCAGSPSVHDLQMSQLKTELIKTIIEPIPVFRFDWSGKTPFVFQRSTINPVQAINSGTAQAVFMWWDLQMDTEGKIILSCAPHWAHPDSINNPDAQIPWRDHWMQAIYYLPLEIPLQTGKEVNLISCHDEYSLWFNLKTDLKVSQGDYEKPICECGLHVAFSRTRIGQINDNTRNKKYLSLLENHLTEETTVLVLGDGFYLSLAAAKLKAKHVYYLETNYLSRRILRDFIDHNHLDNITVFENLEELKNAEPADLVIGEPYFLNSILPWDQLSFLYSIRGLDTWLDNAKIFPKVATIRAVAVNFTDLHKIRIPLDKCEGFSMQDFDDLIEASSHVSDDDVEAQPLWEYPGIAVSEPIDIVSIDSSTFSEQTIENEGLFKIDNTFGGCNGLALWIDWLHGEEQSPKTTITTGPTTPLIIGEQIHWDIHTRQGVCLFPNKNASSISYEFKFDLCEGNVSFKCKSNFT